MGGNRSSERLGNRPRVRRSSLAALAGLVTLTALACSGRSPREIDPAARFERSTIRVLNRNHLDVRIFIEQGGQRVALGYVGSNEELERPIPTVLLGTRDQIRLIADPVGSRAVVFTPPLYVAYGQHIEWRLEENFNLSSVRIR